MNPLPELFVSNGLLLDAAGVLGLGLIGLAAIRLARKDGSWGGTLMSLGAISLLAARLFVIIANYFSADLRSLLGADAFRILAALPPLFLTLGFAAIVWGLWAHDRFLRETSADRRS